MFTCLFRCTAVQLFSPRYGLAFTPHTCTAAAVSLATQQNERTRAARVSDHTGATPGGPQDVTVGQFVPSSDTDPNMDPAESSTYSQREQQDAPEAKPAFLTSDREHGEYGLVCCGCRQRFVSS